MAGQVVSDADLSDDVFSDVSDYSDVPMKAVKKVTTFQ